MIWYMNQSFKQIIFSKYGTNLKIKIGFRYAPLNFDNIIVRSVSTNGSAVSAVTWLRLLNMTRILHNFDTVYINI